MDRSMSREQETRSNEGHEMLAQMAFGVLG